ncbi:MAG: hypothetical protein U0Q21_13005 [Dermatophilaceae bacterium]
MLGPASDPLQVAANEFCAGESKPASLLVEAGKVVEGKVSDQDIGHEHLR